MRKSVEILSIKFSKINKIYEFFIFYILESKNSIRDGEFSR